MTNPAIQSVTEQFEENRGHLRAVAYRMLGSLSEADDAVQDAWLRLSHSDISGVKNPGGWLTTIVARVCLDMLRARAARREDPVDETLSIFGADAEDDAELADSVGHAMLVVLDTLAPAERVAYVLHDMFDLPFDEIATIVERTPATTRQLASRARRRLQGAAVEPGADLDRQREVAEAFLAASRAGDFERLVAVLDPGVVLRHNGVKVAQGARTVAGRAFLYRERAAISHVGSVDGGVGVIYAPSGRPELSLGFTIRGARISEIRVWRQA
jgi:RNA polymerase sigma factor (sigma-70 family)